jgi:hypothetical protein
MKRFTDTEKWQPWFRKLPTIYKAFWFFLCDACDYAGVWERDDEVARIYVDKKLDIDAAIKVLNEDKTRIVLLRDNTRLFLTDFITFQYSRIRKDNKTHAPVYRDLAKNGIASGPFEYDPSIVSTETLQSLKNKDKSKDKNKDKGLNNKGPMSPTLEEIDCQFCSRPLLAFQKKAHEETCEKRTVAA